MVPTDSEGFSASEIHGKLGLKASDTAELALDGVEVGDDALLGQVGDGFKVAMTSLDSGRFSVASGCVGICQGCLDASVSYAKERTQFGRPIAAFQLVQALIADMVLDTEAGRSLVWKAGWLKDQGRPNTLETSTAKLFATEAAIRDGQQRHPGARRLGLRGRLPGGAPPARRPRGHPVRGHVADPEADHRSRHDRRERDDVMETAVTTERDGAVGLIRIDHAASRNTLTAPMLREIVEALEGFDADPEVHCVVIAGTREVFAIGGDVADADRQDPADLWRRLREPLTPTIAAVSGQALGGGWELALSCDMVIATEGTEFGQPEIALGLIPGGGATQRLTRAIGRQRTMEMVLTGRRIDTDAAVKLGLVNQSVRSRDWLDQVMEVARFVASRAAAGGSAGQAGGAQRRGAAADLGLRGRAAPVPPGHGHRGPRGGHAGLSREAQAEVRGPLSVATADVTILALGRPDPSASAYIAAIQRHLEGQDRVGHRMHAMGTSLEGSVADILAVVGELHALPFDQGIPRVYTVLKLDERRDRPEQTLDDKVESVQRRLEETG